MVSKLLQRNKLRRTPALTGDAPPTSAVEPHFGYFATKRALDIVLALLALIVTLPLFVVAALAIKLSSRGPVFYRHSRVGEGGRRFVCRKFRSMYVGAADDRDALCDLDIAGGPAFKAKSDPRVSRVGWVLRHTSIDELPQLINVIRGEIALVGPRPLAIEDYDRRHETIASDRTLQLIERRLRVKPGITGLWQVSGRSTIPFEGWMELDEEYIHRRSLLFDLLILIRTVPAVITMRGAH